MFRSRHLPAWWLIGVGAFSGCRIGYDEIPVIVGSSAGDGGTSASGGTAGSNGGAGGTGSDAGGAESGAGEAGTETAGGMSATGGSAGSTASGGSSAAGGEAGAPGSGGLGAAGASAGAGEAGAGEAGASAGATSGAGGASGEAGASDGGLGGAGNVGGTGGALGSGGFAGAASLGDCRTDTFGGHDYVFCNVNLAWTVARDNCASIGMFLVRLDETTESQWVYDNVYDTPPRQGVWIGASDLAQEGEWRWSDGTLFWLGNSAGAAQAGLFSAWHPMQPSGQEPRDCAALDGTALGWYDLDCAIPQPYACESP